MRSLRPIAITAVFVAALASCWTWSRRATPNEQAMIEAEVANGWTLRNDAVPSTLAEAERSAFALVPDATYLKPDVGEEWYDAGPRGVVPGQERSPWAVWTTRALLSAKECAAMSKGQGGTGASACAYGALLRLRSAPRQCLRLAASIASVSLALGRSATFSCFPNKVRRVGCASRGAAARDRRLRVCWGQLGPLANPHGRPAAQRDTYGHGRGLRSAHEVEAGRSGVPSYNPKLALSTLTLCIFITLTSWCVTY